MRRRGLALALGACLAACQPACERHENAETLPLVADSKPADEAGSRQPRRPDGGRALPGRFRAARRDHSTAPPQQQLVEQLEAIGYLSGSEPARASGITRHDRDRAQAGLNFFTSGHTEGAALMDMDGNVLHEWRYRFADAFESDPSPKRGKREDWWRRAYLFPNGDVLAIITGSGILKLDKNSELLWAKAIYSHHDLAFAPNGDFHLLVRKVHVVPRVNAEQPIVEDLVVLFDADGNEKQRFSLLAALESSQFADLWYRTGRRTGDIFHTNSIERLDGRAGGANPAFRDGNLLISLLNLHAIAVVDPAQEKVVWAHTGDYRKQHDPKILPDGNLLLFDNLGERGSSAILEFDPGTMEMVWEYRGTPEQPFFSKTCGTSERLAGGNTLITETDFGRVFEVTPGGDIVWEYYNPQRAGEGDRYIASVPEMIRLPADFPTDWLADSRSSPKRSE